MFVVHEVPYRCIILSNSMEQSSGLHGLNSAYIWQTKYVQLVAILICDQTLGRNMILTSIWGNTTYASLTRLVKLQKRAAWMILKADFMTPSGQLFRELNWLPFQKRVQYHTCLTVYKAFPGKLPNISLHCSRMSRITMKGRPGQQL